MEIRPGFIRRKTFSRALPCPGLCGMQDSGSPAPNPSVFLPPGLKTQKIWDPFFGSHIFIDRREFREISVSYALCTNRPSPS